MGSQVLSHREIKSAVCKAVKTTVRKFRENPYYFFTESDIHSYFYHVLYSSRLEVQRGNKRIYLVHREYPTNFRYSKDDLVLDACDRPFDLSSREGDRGNYDVAIINPDFVRDAKTIEHIVNKNVRLVEERNESMPESFREELLFAIEFKYVTRNTIAFVTEVLQDNKKLLFATKCGAQIAMNMVFCNIQGTYVEHVRAAVKNAPQDIRAVFVQSDGKKPAPREISNHDDDFLTGCQG